MGQFIRVNGDYNIKAIDGGTIKLDTGLGVGRVVVTGDLVVQGATTTVDAADLNIRDNLIITNFGETGQGVTLQYSGIQVDRGFFAGTEIPFPPAAIVFNEDGDYWQFANGLPGSYNFATSRVKVNELLTQPVTDINPNGDLLLIGTSSPNGVITVAGTTSYELNVTNDDDIPNKKYVDDAIFNNPTFQIRTQDTRVIIVEESSAESQSYYTDETGINIGDISTVSVIVDGNLVADFRNDQVFVQSLKFEDNTISINTALSLVDENIKFITVGTTGTVQFDNAVRFDQIATDPAYIEDTSLVYAKNPEIGRTGLFFRNDSPLNYVNQGELVSKNRALLFSMIF
jgi:hypothetical protein